MFGISFSVGASPGACGLELASVAWASARTGRGTGCERAGLGSRLDGEVLEAPSEAVCAFGPPAFGVEEPDVFAADDGAGGVFDAVGATDWAEATRPGATNKRPASEARAAIFLM
jgi:hypothetical protein